MTSGTMVIIGTFYSCKTYILKIEGKTREYVYNKSIGNAQSIIVFTNVAYGYTITVYGL